MEWSEILSLVNLILILLLPLFLFLGREAIKQAFAKSVQKDLENLKHGLQLELESYKTGLIREFEQYRANIDLRRTIALRQAEGNLKAIQDLFPSLTTLFIESCTFPTQDPAHRTFASISESVKAYRQAYRAAEIFLPSELRGKILSLVRDVHALAGEYSQKQDKLNTQDPIFEPFTARSVEIDKLLKAELVAIQTRYSL